MALLGIAGCFAAVALALFLLHRHLASTRRRAAAQPAQVRDATRIPGEGDDHTVAAWIWRHLVPRSGQALSVQGELLRAVEKLRHEAQGNGNINWDEGFERLIDVLHLHLVERGTLPGELASGVLADLARLRNFLPVEQLEDDSRAGQPPCIDDGLYDRLTGAVVAFSRLHPAVIARLPDPELHR
jgi:hypothetical protein